MPALRNIDRPTVEHFGAEWDKFDQRGLPRHELERLFEAYFSVFPWERLPPSAEGFDIGCGSGRWAAFVAARVGRLHCIDASERALAIARRNLKSLANCDFYAASFDDLPLRPDSMDFGLPRRPASRSLPRSGTACLRFQAKTWGAAPCIHLLCARKPPLVVPSVMASY